MDLYYKKRLLKIFLIGFAFILFCISFWVLLFWIKDVAMEERKQVHIWAKAIQKKAKLVKYTKVLFNKLEIEELKKVNLWIEATRILVEGNNKEINLALQVVESNTSIPIIITDEDSKIIFNRNIEHIILNPENKFKKLSKSQIRIYNDSVLYHQLELMKQENSPIKIRYYNNKFQYLYFSESKILKDLKSTFLDIQNSFISEVVNNSLPAPILFYNEKTDSVIEYKNIPSNIIENKELISKKIIEMALENDPIKINLGKESESYFIYYQDSKLLNRLKYFPIIEFFVIISFIFVSYWLFNIYRKSEQDKVWVGMSKETAHQLGTPISSIMGWIEILKDQLSSDEIINEMNKDITQLNLIADRFSKIGAKTSLKPENIVTVITKFITYLKKRNSSKINFKIDYVDSNIITMLNVPLFNWVIENLCKNAIDSMRGIGNVNISIQQIKNKVIVDIKDSGHGILKGKKNTVFKPGYTTKNRGWGLGLSLTKRIIEDYHKGKIFVKQTEINKGSIFRIILNANK